MDSCFELFFDMTDEVTSLVTSIASLEKLYNKKVTIQQYEEYFKCKVTMDGYIIALVFDNEKNYHWFILKNGL